MQQACRTTTVACVHTHRPATTKEAGGRMAGVDEENESHDR